MRAFGDALEDVFCGENGEEVGQRCAGDGGEEEVSSRLCVWSVIV